MLQRWQRFVQLPIFYVAVYLSNRLMSADVLAAAIVGVLALLIWEGLVRITNTSPYLLPVPLLILLTLVSDWCELFP